MITTPDKWIIISISKQEYNTIYKVFASWAGGYLNGDSWQLNSGIKEIKRVEDNYIITGFSGSQYVCGVNQYGIIGNHNQLVLENIKSKAEQNDWEIKELSRDYQFENLLS